VKETIRVELSEKEAGLISELLRVLIETVDDLDESEYGLLYNMENREVATELLEKLNA